MASANGNNSIRTFLAIVFSVIAFGILISTCSKFIDNADNSAGDWPPASGAAENYYDGQNVWVVASRLNIRALPNAKAKIAGQLNKGEKIKVLDRSGEWLRLETSSGNGWVAAKLVADSDPMAVRRRASADSDREITAKRRRKKQQSSLGLFGGSSYRKTCKKGQPCGNSCISWDKVCRK